MTLKSVYILGPQRWHERYTAAKGKLQSPINIEAESAMDDSSLGAIQFNYPTNIADTTLTNDGRILQVTFQDKSSSKKIFSTCRF